VSWANSLTLAGIAAESAFLAMMMWRRTYKTLPIFFCYIIWGLVSDSAKWLFALHVQRSFAVLRILFFMALAGCSQFLRIGWRDRELQVATGLGFYSLVSLAGTMVHSHQVLGWQYFYVEVAVAGSYLLSLVYWIFSFAQQEAPRRKMTPEMESLLLRVAGAGRRQRDKLSASNSGS
jgi:hypothetical protein